MSISKRRPARAPRVVRIAEAARLASKAYRLAVVALVLSALSLAVAIGSSVWDLGQITAEAGE